MATPKRNFKAGVPYLCTQRFHSGVQWLDCPTLRRALVRQLVLAAQCTRVAVLACFLVGNHIHLILVQDDDGAGHLTEGIACFMRNAFSVFCRMVCQRHVDGKAGHVVQRRYDAQELKSGEDLMRALAYVHGQDVHHQIDLDDILSRSSWGAVVLQQPDGIVTDIIEHGLQGDQLEALLTETITRACEAERQPDVAPYVWPEALRDTIDRLVSRGLISHEQRVELRALVPSLERTPWQERAPEQYTSRRDALLEAGIIGRHFVLLQEREANRISAVLALRGRGPEGPRQYGPVHWLQETRIDYRPRPDPEPPPRDS